MTQANTPNDGRPLRTPIRCLRDISRWQISAVRELVEAGDIGAKIGDGSLIAVIIGGGKLGRHVKESGLPGECRFDQAQLLRHRTPAQGSNRVTAKRYEFRTFKREWY